MLPGTVTFRVSIADAAPDSWLSVLSSVITYLRMMPFCSSNGGASHFSAITVGDGKRAKFWGVPIGTKMREKERERERWMKGKKEGRSSSVGEIKPSEKQFHTTSLHSNNKHICCRHELLSFVELLNFTYT